MNPRTKNIWSAIGCVAAICASAVWIYFTQFRPPQVNETLHRGIGEVMAEETKQLLGNKGRIIVVAINTPKTPELKVQLEAFKTALEKSAIKIDDVLMLDTKDQPKYRTGGGFSSGRFVRTMQKHKNMDALVSFVGAPHLSDSEYEELSKFTLPKFIAQSMATEKLPKLFEKKVLQVAIVPRYEFPSPISGNPKNSREWFLKRFQVMTEKNVPVP
ncbi:MAG: hypothetical protein ABI042_04380 [Verrucomicrobiota bacterium]